MNNRSFQLVSPECEIFTGRSRAAVAGGAEALRWFFMPLFYLSPFLLFLFLTVRDFLGLGVVADFGVFVVVVGCY